MRTSLVVLVFAFAGLLAVDLQSSASRALPSRPGASRHGAEAVAGDGRGRVRPQNGWIVRVDRVVPRGMTPAEAALRELTQGPTRAERRQGIRTALPERARLRSLRADGQTWLASFSRATLGTGSAETKRTRLWQIAATLAPLGDEDELAARGRGALRDDGAPRRAPRRLACARPARTTTRTSCAACSSDSPSSATSTARTSPARTRLPHGAGAPRLPGLGGPRPHGHGHGADAGRALPCLAAAAGVARRRGAASRSTALAGSCSWSRTERSYAPCTRPRARWVARRPGSSRSTPRSLYSWSVPFHVWMPFAAYFRGGIATAPVTRRSLVSRHRTAACASPRAKPSASTASSTSARRSPFADACTVPSLVARRRLLVCALGRVPPPRARLFAARSRRATKIFGTTASVTATAH